MARDRVALDTHVTRVLPTITLNALQERYSHSVVQTATLALANWTITGSAPPSRNIGTILDINCVQNSAYQPPLKRLAWTDLNVQFRQQGPLQPAAFPSVWAPFEDGQNFYIANVCGSQLSAEIDAVYLPNALVNGGDLETAIADPVSELVPLMAARWAMYYQDELDTALQFWAHYKQEKQELMAYLPPFGGFT